MTETIFLRIGDNEVQDLVPAEFWRLLPEDRVDYIKQRWPDATWAGNGVPGLYACSHFIHSGGA